MTKKLTLAIGIQSPDKEQIKKIVIEPNQEERKYFNSFKKPAKKIQAFLISESSRKEELEVFESESKTGHTKVFHCNLKKGMSEDFGISLKLTISEIYQNDTKLYCYGVTSYATKTAEVIEPELESPFNFKNVIGKKKKGKSK